MNIQNYPFHYLLPNSLSKLTFFFENERKGMFYLYQRVLYDIKIYKNFLVILTCDIKYTKTDGKKMLENKDY